MPDRAETATKMPAGGPASRFARLVRFVAFLGGLVAVGYAAMVCASIVLRLPIVGLGGVPGDFEIVQMLTAVTIFASLPYCQWGKGHVIVDALTQNWRHSLNRRIDAIWELVAAAVFAVLGVQMVQGAAGMAQSHTNTMVLGLPLAPSAYVSAGLVGLLALVAAWKGLRDLIERRDGR